MIALYILERVIFFHFPCVINKLQNNATLYLIRSMHTDEWKLWQIKVQKELNTENQYENQKF